MSNEQFKLVGIYTRVSMVEQATSEVSLRAQKERLEKYCDLHDWKIVDYYEAAGVSGGTMDRPDLGRMLKDAEKKDQRCNCL